MQNIYIFFMILFSLDSTSSLNYTFLEKKREGIKFLLTESRLCGIPYHEMWKSLNISNHLTDVCGFVDNRFNNEEQLWVSTERVPLSLTDSWSNHGSERSYCSNKVRYSIWKMKCWEKKKDTIDGIHVQKPEEAPRAQLANNDGQVGQRLV